MLVQAQEEIGKGSENPPDPLHTPTIIQPSTSQPLRKQKPRKTKRKGTELPQTSVPTEHVADEAVNKELNDSLERATITATSLDAESENASKFSNDPLLAGVNTPRSGKDSMKLIELMDLYTNLQQRFIDLETTKTSQAQEIISLKKRVKRLEKKKRSRTHGLKRLYKVGLSSRIESFDDEASLDEEDASKQGRISDINDNQDIHLVNVHRDEDMFGVNDQDDTSMFDADKDLQGEEVIVEKEVVGKDDSAVEEVNAANIATFVSADAATTVSIDELTLAQALIVSLEKSNKECHRSTNIKILPVEWFACCGIGYLVFVEEEEEERLAREKAQRIKEVNIAWDDVQAKIEADFELA
nr:hypothetical protein [Tanacetum cinerariifolium]